MATVICMGELLWDCVAHEVGVPYEAVTQWHRQLGGAPANVAFGVQQLGLTAALISCVGRDEAGLTLLKHCQERGIDSRGIQPHPHLTTRHVEVLRLENGDRTFAGFGQSAPPDFADRHIQAQSLPTALFEAADYLVIGTVAWAATESRGAIVQALDLADEFNVKVFLDVNWRPMFWDDPAAAPTLIRELWPRIDFLKLSTEEAQLLFNTTDAGAIATQIDSIEGVWVTAGGKEPISYYLSGNTGQVQPLRIEAIDTTGAGDSFVAGLIAQLCQRGLAAASQPDIAQAITTYGAAAGALSTRQVGAIAAQPTVKEVTEFLVAQGRA